MIINLIHGLGLEVSYGVNANPDLLLVREEKKYGVFHVPNAVGSQIIPAQQEFVIAQGIKSVVGFGKKSVKN